MPIAFLENLKKGFSFFSNPFKIFLPKRMLGIDIGTASIKAVEISRWGQGKTLENYVEIKSISLFKEPFRSLEKGSYLLSNYFVARAIKAMLQEAKIRTRAAIFSIPDFSTFCTSFELPPMSKEELSEAVYYNASQFIPLPIAETTLDWKLIEGEPGGKTPLKVFLVAIPSQTIQDYQTVAQMAGLELYAVEAEAISLTRALVRESKGCFCLIDIGVQSTIVNIVEGKRLKKSYSLDFSGNQLTFAISSSFGIENQQAEEIKLTQGLLSSQQDISKTLYLLVDPLIAEVKKILSNFYQEERKEVQAIYLSGGTVNLPGLKEYLSQAFRKKVEVPNCFSDLLYPPILEKTLEELSPRFSIAVGAALGGLED